MLRSCARAGAKKPQPSQLRRIGGESRQGPRRLAFRAPHSSASPRSANETGGRAPAPARARWKCHRIARRASPWGLPIAFEEPRPHLARRSQPAAKTAVDLRSTRCAEDSADSANRPIPLGTWRARAPDDCRNSVRRPTHVAVLQDRDARDFNDFRGTALAATQSRPGGLPDPRTWLTHPSTLTPPPTLITVPRNLAPPIARSILPIERRAFSGAPFSFFPVGIIARWLGAPARGRDHGRLRSPPPGPSGPSVEFQC